MSEKGYRSIRALAEMVSAEDSLLGGRWIDRSSLSRQERIQNIMAFQDIFATQLPESTGRGQASTEPKVGIRENGQIAFNGFCQKRLDEIGATAVTVKQDSDNKRKLALVLLTADMVAKVEGLAPEKQPVMFKLSKPEIKPDAKNKSKASYFSGSRMLKLIGYDYAKAGNQVYSVTEEKMNKAGTVIAYVLTLPDQDPAPKPKQTRTRKATATGPTPEQAVVATATETPATVVNGVVPPPTSAPASEDLFA